MAPPSPPARSRASTKRASLEDGNMPVASSPTRKSFCPLPSQRVDAPVRLDSLRPPPPPSAVPEPARNRKVSLTDPNEPFLRLQITHHQTSYQPRAHSQSHPTTPTFLPNTSSTTKPRASTRPSSLANNTSLPPSTHHSTRNNSATPSDLSSLFPYASTVTTSPPSVCRSSFALQNPTSAWDDWDSESEGEKVRLVGWIGRRKAKGKSVDKESKNSIDSTSSEGDMLVRDKKASKEEDRLEKFRLQTAESARTSRLSRDSQTQEQSAKKKRPSGFVRAISCGCRQT